MDRYALAEELSLEGSISFEDTEFAATDFGRVCHHRPLAVVFPASVKDILAVVRFAARSPGLTVAARGNGHSIHGQAQAPGGVVIDMPSLKGIHVCVARSSELSYVDASGGELWIDVLQACLQKGYAPRSWPDYLYLSVGGTLQTAGVGGQTFRFGPVISNILQLEVVTGRGELVNCSPVLNPELFFAVLGGLGQFGIVSKARIAIAKAPSKVRWIRALYADFRRFTSDQENLISTEGKTFDYVEGFVVCNNDDPVNGWRQVTFTKHQKVISDAIPESAGPVLYCLEVAMHYYEGQDEAGFDEVVEDLLRPLGFIEGLRFQCDVPYAEFLNRVHAQEIELSNAGLWQVPHPWLCLLVPSSCMELVDAAVFKKKLIHGVGGPMLIYPMLKSKWDKRMSVITPNEDIFYLISLLRANYPPPRGPHVESLLAENDEIIGLLRSLGIPFTLYMPHFTSPKDCNLHFGSSWQQFASLKQAFDPLAILAPGQCIFPRVRSPMAPVSSSVQLPTTYNHSSLLQDLDCSV